MAEKKSGLDQVRTMLEQAHKDGDLSAEDLVKQMQLLDEKNTAEIEAFIRYQKQHRRKQKNKKGGMTASVPPEDNGNDQKMKRILPRSREDCIRTRTAVDWKKDAKEKTKKKEESIFIRSGTVVLEFHSA